MAGARKRKGIRKARAREEREGEGERNSTLHQSFHGFATRVHGFASKTKALAREIPPASQATRWRATIIGGHHASRSVFVRIHSSIKAETNEATGRSDRSLRQIAPCVLLAKQDPATRRLLCVHSVIPCDGACELVF